MPPWAALLQNDVITIAPNLKDAVTLKMAISFALSQVGAARWGAARAARHSMRTRHSLATRAGAGQGVGALGRSARAMQLGNAAASRHSCVPLSSNRCVPPRRAAQSVKLSVLEDRVLRMAALTKQLPNALAREGKVKIRWAGGRAGACRGRGLPAGEQD